MSAPEGNPSAVKGNWLTRRLASWLGLGQSGDTIVAEVGAGARWVAVGKNIVQIGALELPTLPVVLTLVAVLGLGAGGLWFAAVPARMPVSPLNIAVAEIGVAGPEGELARSEDGERLSEWIFSELKSDYTSLPGSQPLVWHDSMSVLEKRSRIGMVHGTDRPQRTASAGQVAARINANIVIHGVLTGEGNRVSFAPEFYVDEVLEQADELVGPHELGAAIPLQLPIEPSNLRTSEYLRAELGPRIEALAWLTRAIVLDTNGRHQQAFDLLATAEVELDDWHADQGREILHYFQGREALYLGRQDSSWLERAKRAYQRALEINPDYARAHIGLGGVYYSLAQEQAPDRRLESGEAELAVRHYERAIAAADGAVGSHVELKGRLGLATTLRLLGETYLLTGDHAGAAAELDEAIGLMERAIPQIPGQDDRLLAEAYLALGAAYHQRGYISQVSGDTPSARTLYKRAESAYSKCIEHAEGDLYDASSQDLSATSCEPYRQQVLEALQGIEGQG